MTVLLYMLAFLLLAVILAFLFIYFSIRENIKWFSRTPAEGKFVDSRGKRIYYRVKGKGEPAVVVINSIGSSQAEWWPIQNEVGLQYRMITFDRAGYGFSTPVDKSRVASNISDELDLVLKFERIKKPVLLVANGTGTVYARHYAATRPENVLGALFINPLPLRYSDWLESVGSIEDCTNTFEQALSKKDKATRGLYRILPIYKGYKLDKRFKRHIIEHFSRTENYDTMQAEFSQLQNSLDEIAAAGDFPEVPLKVLFPGNESLIRDWIRNGTPEYSSRQLGRIYQELSSDITSLSPKTSVLEVQGSGENVHLSKPDIIAGEIIRMLNEQKK